MKFRFAHRPFQPQKQSVVEVRRIVQPVLVEDKRIGERTKLKQTMPIGVVARKARYLQTKYNSDAPQADLGDEALEALAVGGARAGLPEIAVDDDDAIKRPAERDSPFAQRVLALGALGVLEDLTQRRLPYVQVGHAREVRGGDFLGSFAVQ